MRERLRFCATALAVTVSIGGAAFGQADWTHRTPAHVPPKRMYTAMSRVGSCTSASNCGSDVVMFGGLNLGQPGFFNQFNLLGDTWIWDGTDWSPITTSVSPPARYGASMTFEPSTGRAILFGGQDSLGRFLGDTWAFSRGSFCTILNGCVTFFSWTQLTFPTGSVTPPGRAQASMAWDDFLRQIVLTGGVTRSGLALVDLNDTWRFTANTWTKESPPSPYQVSSLPNLGVLSPARSSAAMETCGESGVLEGAFLFGGFNGFFTAPLGDTYLHADRQIDLLTNDAWFGKTVSPSPAARFGHAMSNYPVSGSAVLYGGQAYSAALGAAVTPTDTWNGVCLGSTPPPIIDGVFPSWTLATPVHNPGARVFHGMTTGPNGFTVVLFGGDDQTFPRSSTDPFPNGRDHNDTWTWGRRVACLPVSGSQLRVGTEVACQFDTAGAVQFGGWSANGFAPPVTDRATAAFHTESPGPAFITARWTDAAGPHIQTFSYTITTPR